MYKYLNNIRHIPSGVFIHSVARNSRRVNNSNKLILPLCNRERTKYSCVNMCIALWNECTDADISLDYVSFRRRIFSNDFYDRILALQPSIICVVDV